MKQLLQYLCFYRISKNLMQIPYRVHTRKCLFSEYLQFCRFDWLFYSLYITPKRTQHLKFYLLFSCMKIPWISLFIFNRVFATIFRFFYSSNFHIYCINFVFAGQHRTKKPINLHFTTRSDCPSLYLFYK